jgi:replication factor C subunit 2/4
MELLKCGTEFKDLDLWTRSLQPKTLDDFIGNEQVISVLKTYCETYTLPNILLTGPHGTCKRTLANIVIRTYLGDDWVRGSLHIEGAVYRGKDTISNSSQKKSDKLTYNGVNMMDFSRTKITLPPGRHRIVCVYNFEDMLIDAQNALRRIMETQSKTTRFILIANSLDNIIEAIQSRCIPLETRVLNHQESLTLISKVSPELPADVSNAVAILSDGDTKKIINYLQTAAAAPGANGSAETFYRIFNIPSVKILEDILINIHSQSALDGVTKLLDRGYNYNDILEILAKVIPRHSGLSLYNKIKYTEILTKYYCWITAMVSPVHLYALFSEFATVSVPST